MFNQPISINVVGYTVRTTKRRIVCYENNVIINTLNKLLYIYTANYHTLSIAMEHIRHDPSTREKGSPAALRTVHPTYGTGE